MQTKRKEIISSWLLLWVFVPMVLLSSLHVHEAETTVDQDCAECVSHTQHSGHLTIYKASVDDCVLCRFLGQEFVTAMKALMPYVLCGIALVLVPVAAAPSRFIESAINRRGPPVVC